MESEEQKKLNQIYLDIKAKIDEFIAGKMTANELNHFVTVIGIYEQRNGKFMVRVRITGGHITAETTNKLAAVMERNGIPYGHITSRQDIQLHDVPADIIYKTVVECDQIGLPFRGGCGNTYRNILVSPDSGFASEQLFDVSSYAQQLNDVMRNYDRAFGLPRKFKIGFFASPDEEFNTALQDLGFLAVIKNGVRGFKVYSGGGMGRESVVGVKIFDFLPDHEAIRCAFAATALFDEHGDRTNRNRARLRFVLEKLGAEAFVKLFMQYFDQTTAPTVVPKNIDYSLVAVDTFKNEEPAEGFSNWHKHAATLTGLGADYVAVRLYIPYGNLTPAQWRAVATLSKDFGNGFLRLMQPQDILLAPVHIDVLPALHRRLLNDFPDLDLTLTSFKGHLLSCVGSDVCKIGILPAPELADLIAKEMDQYLPADSPQKLEKLRFLTSQLRISGCHNACSGHPAAKIGIQGQKKRIAEKLEAVGIICTGVSDQPGSFSFSKPIEGADPVLIADLPGKVKTLLESQCS